MEYPKLDLVNLEKLPFEKEFIKYVLINYLKDGKTPIEIENEYYAKQVSTGALAVKILNSFGLLSSKQEFDNKGIYNGKNESDIINHLLSGKENYKRIANALQCIEKKEIQNNIDEIEKFKKYYFKTIHSLKADIELYDGIRLRKEFQEEYPLEKLKNMTLSEYVLGESNSYVPSLSYQLEFGKYKHTGLSIGGGSSAKHGIYKGKDGKYHGKKEIVIDNPEEFWQNFRNQLYNFLCEIGNTTYFPDIESKYPLIKNIPIVAVKLSYLYFPEKFINVGTKGKLLDIIDKFEIDCDSIISSKLSHTISAYIRENIPEICNDDPQWIGHALWRYMNSEELDDESETTIDEIYPYTPEMFKKDVFIPDEKYNDIVELLDRKKNIILTGAPGVGKTYMAKRIVYSLQGTTDKSKMLFVQFHQSYSYEEFIEGYRPGEDGNFKLEKGLFYTFCKKAENNPGTPYYLIIDEINRGNLSKIFGELLMLIESDKRGEKLQLAYSKKEFSVPKNLFIIGLMNTADRSLAIIDYALRRRFSFVNIEPAFNSSKFKTKFLELYDDTCTDVIDLINRLNNDIQEDLSLGSGFMIGHSYFSTEKNGMKKSTKEDIKQILNYEIKPLIEEYWYDEKEMKDKWIQEIQDYINR